MPFDVPSPGTKRLLRRLTAAGCLLAASSCSSGRAVDGPLPETVAPPSTVDRLLVLSELESITATRAREFTRRVALLGGDLTDAELELLVPAVQAGFAEPRLRGDVARFLERSAPPAVLEEVVAILEAGTAAELDRAAALSEPELSLEEFALGLASDPPPRERVGLLVEWTRAQGAGDFYVLMDQALAEGAHTVLAEFRSDAPPFVPLAGDALFERLEASFNAAVVTFLHRFDSVPDELIAGATAEYESEAGQWYVETYSLAVAEALRSAAARTAASLRATGVPGGRR